MNKQFTKRQNQQTNQDALPPRSPYTRWITHAATYKACWIMTVVHVESSKFIPHCQWLLAD